MAALKAPLIRLRLVKRAFWERATGSQTIFSINVAQPRCPGGAIVQIKFTVPRRAEIPANHTWPHCVPKRSNYRYNFLFLSLLRSNYSWLALFFEIAEKVFSFPCLRHEYS